MSMVEIPNQPNDTELTWDEMLSEIAALEGSRVAVRVVERHDPEALVAVFRGHLQPAISDRQPTVVWPVRASSEDEVDDLEVTGIYLQRERFDSGVKRGDNSVLVITQGPVIVNIRCLS